MIRSMTGYGEAERVFDDLICRVEIRTVNHRFFNANFRAPSTIARLEIEIQKGKCGEKITRLSSNNTKIFHGNLEIHIKKYTLCSASGGFSSHTPV